MRPESERNVDKEFLRKKGWWPTSADEMTWLCEGMNPKYGGHTLSEAVKRQQEMEIIERNGAYFYYVPDRMGFGYWIGKYIDRNQTPRRTQFTGLTKEEAQKLVTKLNKDSKYEPILGVDYQEHQWNRIIIFKEKHGDRHFIAQTRSDMEKIALKIVLEREDEGWYDFEYEEPVLPKIALEKADEYGATLAEAIKAEWKSYEYSQKQCAQSKKLAEALKKIVKEKDGDVAIRFLNEMKGGEYEAFEVTGSEEF
jgi:hypothetical protein